jgi:hypothetical protein
VLFVQHYKSKSYSSSATKAKAICSALQKQTASDKPVWFWNQKQRQIWDYSVAVFSRRPHCGAALPLMRGREGGVVVNYSHLIRFPFNELN